MYNSTFSPKQRLNFIVSVTKKYKILNYGSYFVLIFSLDREIKMPRNAILPTKTVKLK